MEEFTTEDWSRRDADERAASQEASRLFRQAYDHLCSVYGPDYGRAAFKMIAHGWIDQLSPVAVPGYRKERIPASLRKKVLERDGYRCRHCGGHEHLAADHVYPEALGGKATLDNLQTLCRSCNTRKGTQL